jgi:hypothetical protein
LKAGRSHRSGADKTGVKTASQGCVGCTLNQGAAIGEYCYDVIAPFEAKQEIVGADFAVGTESCFHFGEVNGAVMLVNLYRIASAERNVRTSFAA